MPNSQIRGADGAFAVPGLGAAGGALLGRAIDASRTRCG